MGPKCIKYIQTRRSNELSLLLSYASLTLRLYFDFLSTFERAYITTSISPVFHLSNPSFSRWFVSPNVWQCKS